MEKLKDGGPAFPIWELNGHGQQELTCVGISARDYFAAKAMQAVLSGRVSTNIVPATCEQIARSAYKMADAMLRARED